MSARVRVQTSVFRIYINHMMTEDRYYDGIGTMDFIKRLLSKLSPHACPHWDK